MNKKFRNKNKVTDVLSFPFYNKKNLEKKLLKEKNIYLGDIIINYNKIENRKKNKKNFIREFNKIWIHGLVHLFGYKHKRDKDFKNMHIVEKNYLKFIKNV